MAKAVKPDFFANIPSLKKDEEAAKRGAGEEERLLYAMSQTAGWKLFSGTATRLIEELDQLLDSSVSSGASIEDIGKNTIVVSLSKGVIKRLLNTVRDAKEACEGAGE